uniref:G_PROTEIN_RECEP_F1_2 domain-containing protein n=1 Tax=Haemonchus contortus TaxID=6289 RepID=A0A7I4YME1_HAECO
FSSSCILVQHRLHTRCSTLWYRQSALLVMHPSFILRSDSISHTACVYLQLPSIFAACLSPLLLLSVATDRLFSLMDFYRPVVNSYPKLYMAAQLLPGCSFGAVMDVWAFLYRVSDEQGICTLATPMKGESYQLYFKLLMATSVLVILCYSCFIFLLKRIRMRSAKVKSMYRSLIIISLTVVFGWFSTSIIVNLSSAFQLNVELYHLHLLAGSFANFTISINFFVYYIVSKEYREIFDKLLGIGLMKEKISCKGSRLPTQPVVPLATGSVRNRKPISVAQIGHR